MDRVHLKPAGHGPHGLELDTCALSFHAFFLPDCGGLLMGGAGGGAGGCRVADFIVVLLPM